MPTLMKVKKLNRMVGRNLAFAILRAVRVIRNGLVNFKIVVNKCEMDELFFSGEMKTKKGVLRVNCTYES